MRRILIYTFPRLFPREVRVLKSTKDLVVAGLVRMHLWPSWITPNRLSMARIIAALPVILLLLMGAHKEALIIFTVGSVSDLFDGALSRLRDGLRRPSKRKEGTLEGVTALGSYLDAIADKTMVIGVCAVALFTIIAHYEYSAAYQISDDHTTQEIYVWAHLGLLGTTALLELWSASKRTLDYRNFRKGLCGIERLQANDNGKYKATLQFFGTGGYVLATEWSLLVGLLLLTGSLALAVKSLWSKYHHPRGA